MIQDKAMMARLTISQWTGRKTDKKVTDEVEKAHGAKDAGNFRKLLVDKALLDPIAKIAGAARDYHYHVTLAWSDNGDRVLPSALFLNYTQAMRKFKSDFETAVSAMMAKYPTEVQAARQRLGTMYDPGDYPDVHDITKKFALSTEFNPIPSANDFRVEVGTDAREAIQADIESKVVERQAQAVKATLARVKDVVEKMYEKLSDDKAVFRDSLVTNVSDLREILIGLNITNNGLINELAVDLKQLDEPPEGLRRSAVLRAKTAQKAQSNSSETAMNELDRVSEVLRELAWEQPIWRKNLQTWNAMDEVGRHYFWERAKKQAQAGVTVWEEVLIRVIERRLL